VGWKRIAQEDVARKKPFACVDHADIADRGWRICGIAYTGDPWTKRPAEIAMANLCAAWTGSRSHGNVCGTIGDRRGRPTFPGVHAEAPDESIVWKSVLRWLASHSLSSSRKET